MADDNRQELTATQFVDHFQQAVSDPDPRFAPARQAFYEIRGWAGGRQLSDEELAQQIWQRVPSLQKSFRVRGIEGAPTPAPTPAGDSQGDRVSSLSLSDLVRRARAP